MIETPRFGAKFTVAAASGNFLTDCETILQKTARGKNIPIQLESRRDYTHVFTGSEDVKALQNAKAKLGEDCSSNNPKYYESDYQRLLIEAETTRKSAEQDFDMVHVNTQLVNGWPHFDLLTLKPVKESR